MAESRKTALNATLIYFDIAFNALISLHHKYGKTEAVASFTLVTSNKCFTAVAV